MGTESDSMHLVYIDEVKFAPPQQKYYWLCGLAIPASAIKGVEDSLHVIADEYFASRILDPSTEFHARDIVHGKGPYNGKDLTGRIELIKKLTSVIEQNPSIGRIQIRLAPDRISRDDYQRIAFMFMVERLDQLMNARHSIGLLIADDDREFANENVRNLSKFKAGGTDFEYGQEISTVVDTVHHTRSHHSRLLQLADIYTYSVCLANGEPDRYPQRELVKHVRGLDPFLFPDKYKFWPP
jgi:hypothetical protein